MKRQWKQIAAICFCLCFAAGAFAKRVSFKSALDLKKLRERNLDAELVKETGDLKLYYRDENGQVKFLIYHPSNKVNIVVSTTVEKLGFNDAGSRSQTPIQQRYRYQYKIANAKTSAQPVYGFTIEMAIPKTAPANLKAPPGWYSRRNPNPRAYNWAKWVASASTLDEKRSGSRLKATDIAPGKQLEGFRLDASGLPGILAAFARGDAKTNMLNDAVEPPRYRENCVKGSVVGPVPEPAVFDAALFAQYIGGLYDQGVKLGWVDGDKKTAPVRNRFRKRLFSAIEAAEAGKTAAAKRSFQSVLAETQSLVKRKLVEPEMDALLTVNIQYLLERM